MGGPRGRMSLTLRHSLLIGLGVVLLVSLGPAMWWFARTVTKELEAGVQSDLELAPMRLADRDAARGDALMMHAKELAAAPGLASAIAAGDRARAERILATAPPPGREIPILVDGAGAVWVGPPPGPALLAAARAGGMPVDFVVARGTLHAVSVAPLMLAGTVVGVAGVAAPLDDADASTLAGLVAADVVLADAGGATLATTLEPAVAGALARLAPTPAHGEGVREVRAGGRRWWVASAALGEVGRAVFALDIDRELAVLPQLRRGALAAGTFALALALALGSVVAARIARPVASLAEAADRFAEGDFGAPLPSGGPGEVERVTRAFERMRRTLARNLAELRSRNAELAEREERLQALQAEMIQRARMAAAGRLVTELAHEIRNPVANVRNCLEVIRRRADDRPDLTHFADLAIDELLRMHELAEQMLDLNRPMDPGASRCDPAEVVERVCALLGTGDGGRRWPTGLVGASRREVGMAPDVLKQVLLSLAQNARDVMPEGGRLEIAVEDAPGGVLIDVRDEGPGIAEDVLPHVFDPFFTTKGDARSVGLGLFIAEGLVRRSGGQIVAANRRDRPGAWFRIELPTPAATSTARRTAESPSGASHTVEGMA